MPAYSWYGMTGGSTLPLRSVPTRIARAISSSVHPPIPCSGSGVMLLE